MDLAINVTKKLFALCQLLHSSMKLKTLVLLVTLKLGLMQGFQVNRVFNLHVKEIDYVNCWHFCSAKQNLQTYQVSNSN